MRGLFQASLLLAPALATALAVPDVDVGDIEVDRVIASHSFALIGVKIPSRSPDEYAIDALAFRLDVYPSEDTCGYGNVTVDGQFLSQTVEGNVATGKGLVMTDRQMVVSASWSFKCVKVNGQPDSQLLKFVVDVIDGKATEDVGFLALFRQTGSTEIISIETDLNLPDQQVANPNPESLRLVGDEDDELPLFNIKQEIDELRWMRAQLKELEYLIWIKEESISQHAHAHFEEEFKDCDSLKCLAQAVVDKARKAAQKVFNKTHSHHGEHGQHEADEEDFDHFPRTPVKKPHHLPKRPKLDKPRNCSHGKPPKHGNHTSPPHWKKPPHKLLPICRYPPPPKKGAPQRKPPHHLPPPPSERPPSPPPENGPQKDEYHRPQGPPGYNEGFSHGHHGTPDTDDTEFPHEGHHDGLSHGELKSHSPPHDKPQIDHRPLGFGPEAPLKLFVDGPHGPPGSPGHHGPFKNPGPRHNGFGKAFRIMNFFAIGVLLSLLIIALHRRKCTSKSRAERKARREERQRRRAFRHTAAKYAVARFFLRGLSLDSDDYEEKRQALLASAAEDGMSTNMTEEIAELRNAADIVDDMVTARANPQVQPITITPPASVSSIASENHCSIRDYDIGSQVGDGEELPAYEDNDGSENSSVVANGFRYTPGSTEYSPSHSPAGSVSENLVLDTKQ